MGQGCSRTGHQGQADADQPPGQGAPPLGQGADTGGEPVQGGVGKHDQASCPESEESAA